MSAMLSCGSLTAALLCCARMIVQPNVCQHSVDRIRSEVMWVVQEASKQLREYERLRKAAKQQEVMANTPDIDTVGLPSLQSLLCVTTCVVEWCG